MFRNPDVPRLITLDYLRELDREPPGTYRGLPKIDGRRRIAHKCAGVWNWRAKNRGDSMPLPAQLKQDFESLPWPDGMELDMEFSGPRHAKGIPELHIFDMLQFGNEWQGDEEFRRRYDYLKRTFERFLKRDHVHLIPAYTNPGLVDRYAEQLTNPLSEGLVIRRADSTMTGHPSKCFEAKSGYYKVKHEERKELA